MRAVLTSDTQLLFINGLKKGEEMLQQREEASVTVLQKKTPAHTQKKTTGLGFTE